MYIRKVEIKNLWTFNFSFSFQRDVNVLIDKNGSGKSTILRMLNEAILSKDDTNLNFRLFDPIDEIIIELDGDIVVRANSENRSITGNEETDNYKLNSTFINTFDVIEKSLNPNTTYLDYKIENLKQKFVTYQRDLSNQVEEALRNNDKFQFDKISNIYNTKNIFIDKLNELFSHTDKKFDEKAFHFLKEGIQNPILPQNLSSGEKQIFIILLTSLLQDREKYILLLDEPEISLHIDWQRKLIENIRAINPNCQIILATHSPTVYYQGWTDKVIRVDDIRSTLDMHQESTIIEEKSSQSKGQVQKIKQEFQNFSGTGLYKLYQFNRKINGYTTFTKIECIELLDFLKTNLIYPDVVTFTTLISKLNSFEDAKEIFDLIGAEKYSQLSHVKPNNITLCTLIKTHRSTSVCIIITI